MHCLLSHRQALRRATSANHNIYDKRFFYFLFSKEVAYRICKNKSVEGFQPYPYIGATINCIFWVFYGIITPNSTLVITINSIGLFMQLVYLAIFSYFSKQQRRKIALFLLAELAVTVVIACIALLAIHSQSTRSILVGVFSVLFGLVLYGSPLTIMIANGVGAILAAAQLILYATYYSSTPKSKTSDDPKKPKGSKPEMQLSEV
ncbi:hypothetical protein RHGRI_022902 [Rhododendron griersonianum]|uniref:Bidirectional sugar transporter SWEET n=1 Tax=Rhododendron griersonianum TaxID=479676 RepID=A0AAV6J708_9ERIC|nr:hypothetical protein RHGRI_022902 [Rhododendron griersonianum]